MAKRRRFSAEYKARVALEALVGDQTLSELAQKHGVHPNMIAAWKRQAKESLPEIFAKGPSPTAADKDAEIKRLHEKIGKLTVEVDFLAKAFRR
jgi:transposase